MKNRNIIFFVVILFVFALAGCNSGDRELRQDAKGIADLMCRNIESMNKLRNADPADSMMSQKLQMEAHDIQVEMTIVYQEFKKKHAEKINDAGFNKKFGQYLREAMLECKSLSKEDRAKFEQELDK
ncbi:MAG: hypothetical protein PHP04_00035 [Bacteroidales bacterium]|nr:hypothetical protein [Bacteroidales bacterium]HNW72598.1 hypothetical protein [Bacteroidales bacterium]HPS49274.1 hypothetical protein [Bacteroidales bacterium]